MLEHFPIKKLYDLTHLLNQKLEQKYEKPN